MENWKTKTKETYCLAFELSIEQCQGCEVFHYLRYLILTLPGINQTLNIFKFTKSNPQNTRCTTKSIILCAKLSR